MFAKFFYISLLVAFLAGNIVCGQSPSPPSEPLSPEISAKQNFVKIASWNIRIFSNSRTDDQLRSICKVAKEFDFISVLELKDELVLQRMLAIMKNEFQRTYIYELSPPVGNIVKELYAFVYDPSVIQKIKDGQIYCDTIFLRNPYYATFQANQFDFTTITIHVIWGDTVEGRRREIRQLASVYRNIQDADPKENDVILLGDFNRNPDDDLAWANLYAISSMIHLFDLPLKSMILDTHLYDNILFQSAYTKEFTLDKNIVKFDESDFGNDDEKASKDVTDHRPVWGLFRTSDPDDD
jgi:endonuclease/exonuclease/phosphatase family metal-dependent hydrolase